MNIFASLAAAIACTLLPCLAAAQDDTLESRVSAVCHIVGSYASQAAMSRDEDVPISIVLDHLRKMSLNSADSPAARKVRAAFTAQVDNAVVESINPTSRRTRPI